MARRNHSLLDDLVTLPWWFNVILAGIVYVSLKFWLPTVEFQNPVFKGMATVFPNVAHIFAGILLLVAALSALHAWRKGRLLKQQTGVHSLNAVTWREFEELVGEAYRRQGYQVAETGGAGADGGVDLVLKKDGETVLAQCKQWKTSKVGVKVVRELYGIVTAEGATRGILIASGTYTPEAQAFARGKPLELISGPGLAKLIGQVKKQPLPSQVPVQSSNLKSADAIICPRCNGDMVLRTAKKGARAGEKFWGCVDFPKCRGTRPAA